MCVSYELVKYHFRIGFPFKRVVMVRQEHPKIDAKNIQISARNISIFLRRTGQIVYLTQNIIII